MDPIEVLGDARRDFTTPANLKTGLRQQCPAVSLPASARRLWRHENVAVPWFWTACRPWMALRPAWVRGPWTL